jgi:hypothetical protein
VTVSAWIVEREHIHVLIWAGLRPDPYGVLTWRTAIPDGSQRHPDSEETGSLGLPLPYNKFELRPDTANRVGQMLVNTNRASVNHRYAGSEDSDGRLFVARKPAVYRYPRCGPRELGWSGAELLKAINCYAYQSCELDDWSDSEAQAFCEALKDRLICRLPGYDDAPWGIDIRSRAAASKVFRK